MYAPTQTLSTKSERHLHVGPTDNEIHASRGQISLEEVEQLMRDHDSVDNAAVLIRDSPDVEPVAFVTLHQCAVESHIESQRQSGDEYEAQQVQLWETVFDRGIYTAIHKDVQDEAIGRDFTGWVSAYNGRPLDQEEMNDWLDDIIATILGCESGDPLDMLELGTGSGMILFSMATRLHSYLGLEPSRTAVEFVNAAARSMPDLANKVKVFQGTATDLHLLRTASPNLVVINSVAQYFPSQEYLLKVIEGILQLDSVRTIFFGDIRSFALQEDFLLSKALYNMQGAVANHKVREQMTELAQAELELLVDPAFFTSLPSRFPNLIEHVEVLPKRMRANNELSSYRYAAIIHVRNQRMDVLQQRKILEVSDDEWIDFTAQKLNHQTLLHHLTAPAPSIVAVSNIPYSKTIFERHAVDSLDSEAEENGPEWLSSMRQKSQECPALSALDLVDLAQQASYRVEISWARQHSQRGGLDAIFHRRQPSPAAGRVLFRFPTDHQGRAPGTFSNQPLQQQAKQAIQQQLYEKLQAEIPPHLVPEEILVLEKLPVQGNGEVDRQALTRMV